ncbi:MAG: rRNA maturation RNase YbeY [Candidatus Nealsonbacteria bacterium]|nr:rRNA maturation RNase YbeY [Candidatus Nealsonbacteria bacterium]
MSISIRSRPRGFPRLDLVRQVEAILAAEKKKGADLTLIFLGSQKMAELNLRYRQRKGPTDVLAFPADAAGPRDESKSYLGEVIICLPRVRQNARKYQENFIREFRRVLFHGVLHLLGYDHEQGRRRAILMKKKEEYYSSLKNHD